jgi:hypothetical protein
MNARIMTFGYNSRLRDQANLVDIVGWADALLHAVAMQKRSPEVSLRGLKAKKSFFLTAVRRRNDQLSLCAIPWVALLQGR